MQRLSAFEYRYLTEFQSHEPEFDYLKSLEIEEKINQVPKRDTCSMPAQVLGPLPSKLVSAPSHTAV